MLHFQGNIGVWHKKVGDKISPGDVLCSIETDKATVDFEMQDEGYIAAELFPAGTKDIPLGTPLVIIVDSAEDVAAFKDYKPTGGATPAPAKPAAAPEKAAPATPSAPQKQAAASTRAATPSAGGSRVFASPLAQNLAQSSGIELASVAGSGPGGRIIKADIEDHLKSPKPSAQ